MPLKTREEYLDCLRAMQKRIFFFGEEIIDCVDHPILRPSINAVALTYLLPQYADHQDLMLGKSNISDEKVNRFTHLFQSNDDLVNKIKMQRLMGQKTGCCFQRCVGMDSINVLDIVTHEMDCELGSGYNQKLRAFISMMQKEDLVVGGAMTDPKGDRRLSPSEQTDPDLYLRTVKKDLRGITIRGAKLHQTGAVNSHQILVMPTRSLKPEERDYAVACALPADADVYNQTADDDNRSSDTKSY